MSSAGSPFNSGIVRSSTCGTLTARATDSGPQGGQARTEGAAALQGPGGVQAGSSSRRWSGHCPHLLSSLLSHDPVMKSLRHSLVNVPGVQHHDLRSARAAAPSPHKPGRHLLHPTTPHPQPAPGGGHRPQESGGTRWRVGGHRPQQSGATGWKVEGGGLCAHQQLPCHCADVTSVEKPVTP